MEQIKKPKFYIQLLNNIQNIEMQTELTNFLKKQNLMLKQQNKQLKTLLELNREALKLTSPFKKGEVNFLPLVSLLYEQNSKLHRKVNQLTSDLQTGLCKALISEQIAFASTEQQKYLTSQLKDKLIKMRKELQSRQKTIIQLTKNDKSNPNYQTKIIQITQITTLTKKFKDEINQLRNDIQLKKQQAAKYKDQKQQLLKLNLILTKQINQLKLISSHQSTGSNNDLGSGDLSKFMNYQKKIIQDQDDPQSDDDQYKDSDQCDSSNINIDQQYQQQPSKILKAPKLQMNKIPKLQLTKAKQIQQLIVQKINNQDNKKKGGVVKQQKYKKIQVEVSILRKKICSLMLQKIQIQKQNNFLKKFVKQLQSRNSLLTQAHIQQEQPHSQLRYLQINQKNNKNHQQDTQTLLDICKDVTLNPILRKVINGTFDLPYNNKILSYDI